MGVRVGREQRSPPLSRSCALTCCPFTLIARFEILLGLGSGLEEVGLLWFLRRKGKFRVVFTQRAVAVVERLKLLHE